MNARDVIDAYVTDVVARLPAEERDDVSRELQVLLNEELLGRAEAVGRDADAQLAIEFLNEFGRPAEVAARYHPAMTVVDAADSRVFVRATIIGLVIIWSLGLVTQLWKPIETGGSILSALGRWWTGTVIPSLWWPGLLVVSFGVAAWARRRWPNASQWKPRTGNRVQASRGSMVMGLVGVVGGLLVLAEPRRLLDVVFGGRAAPAAYAALTYTEPFLHRQGPLLFILLALNIPMLIAVIVKGRWSRMTRRLGTILSVLTCAVMAWTVLDGPVMMVSSSDRLIKLFMGLCVVITVVDLGIKRLRTRKPVRTFGG